MNTKKCLFCGQEFTPRNNRQIYCDREHWRKCPSCGQIYLERYHENLSKPARLCCSNCVAKSRIYELPEFKVLAESTNSIIIDSAKLRNKYDNLHITQHYQKLGIECIHVFPGDNVDRIISQQSVLYQSDASEYRVYKINLSYAQEFLEQNDIVPYYKSTSLALGLIKDYEIYQLITFAKPRYSKEHDAEIIRCCTKLHHQISGGFDLISSEASLQFGVTSCIAYHDASKGSCKKLFDEIGMKFDHANPPHLRTSNVYDCGTEVYTFN